MSTLSRRTLVTSAAALPALSIPAAATAITAKHAQSDAKLLKLGADLERIEREWLQQRLRDQAGVPDPDLIGWGRIHDAMGPWVHAILREKAHTLAGLAVQARAMVFDHAEWWDNELDDEDEFANARLQLESLCDFLAIEPAPMALARREMVEA